MICPRCGNQNNDNTLFCVACGARMNNIENTNQTFTSCAQNNYNKSIFELIKIILMIIIKPISTLKNEVSNFNEFKLSLIFSIVVSIIGTLGNLITTMFNEAYTTSYGIFGSSKTTFNFEYLKDIDYLNVIGKMFLMYLISSFVIAGVYYIGTLIIKKQVNFSKLIYISSSALIPMILCSFLSPFLSLIVDELGIIMFLIGIIYMLLIIYEGILIELQLDGNIKIYFNLICLSLIYIIIGYIGIKLLEDILNSGMLEMF